jgi:hypothetical protein
MSKIKLRHVIVAMLIVLLAGYTIGQFIPIEYLKPTITDRGLTINDLYTRIISIVGTCVTILAVIVALFKEDIRKIWDKASLEVSFKEDISFNEVLDNETIGNNNYRAKKYETGLTIKNTGSQAAKSCEIFLESLQFQSDEFASHQEIQLNGKPLRWSNNSNSSILIPATGKAHVSIIEVLSVESQVGNPGDANAGNQQPKIRIGDTENPSEYTTGKWIAKFKIYSENASPIEHKIQVRWNCRWENRATEMGKHLKIQVIN